MMRFYRLTGLALGMALLAACGAEPTPGDFAAQACEVRVKEQLGSKPYQLDLTVLASSMKDDGRGSQLLTAPIVVSAGMAEQSNQMLECTARLNAEKTSAEVLDVRFIW
jgi:hypothetical protein